MSNPTTLPSDTPPTQIREAIEKTILKNKPVTYLSTKDLTNTIDELTALLIAEYKQLLTELVDTDKDSNTSPLILRLRELESRYASLTNMELNEYYQLLGERKGVDQCRAIIQRHIDELA